MIDRRAFAAEFGFVEDVVVDEGGHVDHFDDGGDGDVGVGEGAYGPTAKQDQARAQHFSAEAGDVFDEGVDAAEVGGEFLREEGVDRFELGGDALGEEGEGRCGAHCGGIIEKGFIRCDGVLEVSESLKVGGISLGRGGWARYRAGREGAIQGGR